MMVMPRRRVKPLSKFKFDSRAVWSGRAKLARRIASGPIRPYQLQIARRRGCPTPPATLFPVVAITGRVVNAMEEDLPSGFGTLASVSRAHDRSTAGVSVLSPSHPITPAPPDPRRDHVYAYRNRQAQLRGPRSLARRRLPDRRSPDQSRRKSCPLGNGKRRAETVASSQKA